MEPQLAFATIASEGLLYTYVNDLQVVVTSPRSACLRVANMQNGTIAGNSSRQGFAIEIRKSPQVQSGLNSPAVRVLS